MEDLLAESGPDISCETVRRWFLKFGESIARNLRQMRPPPGDYWHLDEMVMSFEFGTIGRSEPSAIKARFWVSLCNRSGTPRLH